VLETDLNKHNIIIVITIVLKNTHFCKLSTPDEHIGIIFWLFGWSRLDTESVVDVVLAKL